MFTVHSTIPRSHFQMRHRNVQWNVRMDADADADMGRLYILTHTWILACKNAPRFFFRISRTIYMRSWAPYKIDVWMLRHILNKLKYISSCLEQKHWSYLFVLITKNLAIIVRHIYEYIYNFSWFISQITMNPKTYKR